jgi:hypothetical protein
VEKTLRIMPMCIELRMRKLIRARPASLISRLVKLLLPTRLSDDSRSSRHSRARSHGIHIFLSGDFGSRYPRQGHDFEPAPTAIAPDMVTSGVAARDARVEPEHDTIKST